MKAVRNVLLVCTVLTAIAVVISRIQAGTYGWDYMVYCGSFKAVEMGLDPYYAKNVEQLIGSRLILPYPVSSLVILAPACANPKVLYPVFYTALLVLVGVWIWKMWPGDCLALGAWLAGGLAAVPYNYFTGNIGILEMVCITGALLAMHRGKHVVTGFAIGLAAAVKLTPLAFATVLALVIWREGGLRQLTRFALGVAGAFVVIHGIAMLISPHYEVSLWLVLTGQIPGQFTPLEETFGNWTNPALPLILAEIFKALKIPQVVPGLIYLGAIAAAVWLWWRMWSREEDSTTLICFGILLVCLLLPRFKPYTFTYAVVALIYLLRRQGSWVQSLVVIISAIVPTLAFRFPMRDQIPYKVLALLADSIQYFAMLGGFLVLLFADYRRWGFSVPKAGD